MGLKIIPFPIFLSWFYVTWNNINNVQDFCTCCLSQCQINTEDKMGKLGILFYFDFPQKRFCDRWLSIQAKLLTLVKMDTRTKNLVFYILYFLFENEMQILARVVFSNVTEIKIGKLKIMLYFDISIACLRINFC